MWRLKKKLLTSVTEPPTAKQNKHGDLITAPRGVKQLYLDTYIERLRNKPINSELEGLYSLKMELWNYGIME